MANIIISLVFFKIQLQSSIIRVNFVIATKQVRFCYLFCYFALIHDYIVANAFHTHWVKLDTFKKCTSYIIKFLYTIGLPHLKTTVPTPSSCVDGFGFSLSNLFGIIDHKSWLVKLSILNSFFGVPDESKSRKAIQIQEIWFVLNYIL